MHLLLFFLGHMLHAVAQHFLRLDIRQVKIFND
jgi:hypothetical protein